MVVEHSTGDSRMVRRSFAMVLFLFSTSAVWGQAKSAVIHIDGEPSMVPLTQRLTQWYHHNNPGTSFEVSGAGPVRGIQALLEEKSDIVQSTRQALGGEVTELRERRGRKFVQVPVATEVAGILVHPSNPVHELSIFELRQILSGAIKNWKQVGGKDAPIQVYGRDNSSDVRDFIETEYMGDASISSSAKTFPKNSALYATVAQDPNAIGFATVNLGLNTKVRFIAIKTSASAPGVAPNTISIASHQYPLVRQLYYIFAGTPSGDLQKFAEWVFSQQGQLVVEASELWPLDSSDRDYGKIQLAKR
jgi:phosphate transport system substrate-binding protein